MTANHLKEKIGIFNNQIKVSLTRLHLYFNAGEINTERLQLEAKGLKLAKVI